MKAIALALLLCLPHAAGAEPPPDEQHWRQVESLAEAVRAVSPTLNRAEAIVAREKLVEAVRAYQHLYPGGTRGKPAVRIELQTLFELGTLSKGDLTRLRGRCDELLRRGPRHAQAEAAYWQLLTERPVRPDGTVFDPRPAALGAWRHYCETYPESDYVPRLASLLFAEAERSCDEAELARLVGLLEAHHADHLTTELLRGAVDLRGRIGQPFHLAGVDPVGVPVDTRLSRGRICLVVFWSSGTTAAETIAAIEAARTRHGLSVVGVDLRTRPGEADNRPAGWQHLHDRLGPAHRVGRRWGIRAVPRVLVIDAGGRLIGVADAAGWPGLLARAIDSNSGGD